MQQKFCIECGNRIIEGAKFCAFCGAKIVELEVPAPAPEPEAAPEPIAEPAPVVEETPVIKPEPVVVEEEPAAEPEPEPEPEPEVVPEPVIEEEPEPEVVQAPVMEEEPAPEEAPEHHTAFEWVKVADPRIDVNAEASERLAARPEPVVVEEELFEAPVLDAADIFEAEPEPQAEPEEAEAPVAEPELVVVEPEPAAEEYNEPPVLDIADLYVEEEPAPEPVVIEPAPEPVVVEPEPEPEPIVVEPEPEPVVVVAAEPEYVPESVVVITEEPEPEPIVVEPEPEPEPMVVEPEPVVVEPEPEPIVIEPEPDPAPENPETVPLPVGHVYFNEGKDDIGLDDPLFDVFNGQTEGTVMLVGPGTLPPGGVSVKKGEIALDAREMEKGVTKILDFGTGKRFEVIFPSGLRAGDTVVVKGTGIRDELNGATCEIRLKIRAS